MEQFIRLLTTVTGLGSRTIENLLSSFFIILILWMGRAWILRTIWKKYDSPVIRYRWQKVSSYTVFALSILFVGRLWFAGIESFTTILGLVTAGLAIALQDFVKSIAGWMFILWRKPFVVGDRIQIGNHKGDVIDIRLFKFSILEIGNWVDGEQSTGRIIHVPNSHIIQEAIANYSSSFAYIWHEIPVLITFESNWERAKKILQIIADKHAAGHDKAAEQRIREATRQYMIFYANLSPTVYTTVRDSGILLTIRLIVDPKKKRNTEQDIWEEILLQFAKEKNIDLAYPTQRYYYQEMGKAAKVSSSSPNIKIPLQKKFTKKVK